MTIMFLDYLPIQSKKGKVNELLTYKVKLVQKKYNR